MGKIIHVQFPPAEYEALWQRYQQSTCQTLSGYVRNVLTSKVIYIRNRNESLENFLEIAVDIKNDLHTIVGSEGHPLLRETVDEILELMQKIYRECGPA